MDFRHAEAYCLMKYISKDQTTIEWLWNSRDGVVPFTIPPDDGIIDPSDDRMMSHADWHEDKRVPFFVPPVGLRIFVSYTEASALEAWSQHVSALKDQEIEVRDPQQYQSLFVRDMVQNEQPRIVTVDEATREEFAARALAASLQGLRVPR